MNKYVITYERGEKKIKTSRIAENAEEAIDKICDQYGWRNKLNMYDADTRGEEWAYCSADTCGGINWNISITATKLGAQEVNA